MQSPATNDPVKDYASGVTATDALVTEFGRTESALEHALKDPHISLVGREIFESRLRQVRAAFAAFLSTN